MGTRHVIQSLRLGSIELHFHRFSYCWCIAGQKGVVVGWMLTTSFLGLLVSQIMTSVLIGRENHSGKIIRIGHRGAAGHAPENTLASLKKAVSLGVDLVEFDVQRTQDGALVLFHDATVERTTNGQGRVDSLSFRFLRTLNAGKGEKIPLLEEALRCLNGKAGAMIELKVPGIVAEACAVVDKANFHGRMIYASFYHEEIHQVRKLKADALTLALIEKPPFHPTGFALKAKATHAGLASSIVTLPVVQALQKEGITVFVFTVNDPGEINRMKQMGVDGIISDYPDRI